MKTYKVILEEMISKEFYVEANSLESALELVENGYREGKYSVKNGNLVCTQICANGPEKEDCTEWYEF